MKQRTGFNTTQYESKGVNDILLFYISISISILTSLHLIFLGVEFCDSAPGSEERGAVAAELISYGLRGNDMGSDILWIGV